MAPRKQEPISKTRVQRNRLLAVQSADAADLSARDAAAAAALQQDWISRGAPLVTDTPIVYGQPSVAPTTLAGGMPRTYPAPTRAAAGSSIPSAATTTATVPTTTGPQLPSMPQAAEYPGYVAPSFTPVTSANPYLDYQRGLTAMADQATANFGNELADVQNRYKTMRDQVMAQFGNTKNPELIAARDIALAELARQSDDATKQVAANYQAAQTDQLRFAEQQKALGAELGAQNAILANVAAGNIAAYADQAGLTDSAAQDTAAFLASQAPREQALASALGLSGGMFQSAMGTSLGEQQMAIQGQIARDLAARQGQVSTSTAQQIAAAQQAEREAGRQAYLNLVMQEMGALEQARGQMTERDFALRQAVLQGGVEAGRFAAEQGRYNAELQLKKEESAYNRWLAGKELTIKEQQLAADFEQRKFENQLALGKYGAEYGTSNQSLLTVPAFVQSLTGNFLTAYPKSSTSGTVASNMEMLGSIASGGLTSANEMDQALQLWSTIQADKNARSFLTKQGISTLNQFVSKAGGTTPVDTSAAQQRVLSGQSSLSQELGNLGVRGR